MMVRKEQEVRRPSRNTEVSSCGCESRSTKPARHVGSEPCDGHVGVRVEAGRQRVRRCVGTRTCEPYEVSLETYYLYRVSRALLCLKMTSSSITRWHRMATDSAGSRCAARSKKMTQ